MNNKERILYSVIILIQLLVIIRLNGLRKLSLNLYEHKIYKEANSRLFSFKGKNIQNQTQYIQFTAYSKEKYIFITFSPSCTHCFRYVEDIKENYPRGIQIPNTKLILITSEKVKKLDKYDKYNVLKLSHEDIIQFGSNIPKIFAVNGDGQILYSMVGYKNDALSNCIYSLKLKDRKNRPQTFIK